MCLKLCFISSLAFFDCKEDGIFPKPPSYNVATTLPSYDEAERTKAETNVPLVPGRVSVSLFFFFLPAVTFSTYALSHIYTCTLMLVLEHFLCCLQGTKSYRSAVESFF